MPLPDNPKSVRMAINAINYHHHAWRKNVAMSEYCSKVQGKWPRMTKRKRKQIEHRLNHREVLNKAFTPTLIARGITGKASLEISVPKSRPRTITLQMKYDFI